MVTRRNTVPVTDILDILAATYPDADCALEHDNPFELLIATILSAQCTDARVNIITRRIFPIYKRPEDFLSLSQAEMEDLIRDCGLFRNKAANILATCRILVEQYGGEVPADREALESLPGVGRKTANVVLATAFGIPAIAVDTHVFRVANRLGLATAKDVWRTEQQLMKRIPEEQWAPAHHRLIHHGRQICSAQRPKCEICPLQLHCRFYQKTGGHAPVAKRSKVSAARPGKASAAKPGKASAAKQGKAPAAN